MWRPERGGEKLAAASGSWPVTARARSLPRQGTPEPAVPPPHTHTYPDPVPTQRGVSARIYPRRPPTWPVAGPKPRPRRSAPRHQLGGELPALSQGCSTSSASRAALRATASPWQPSGGLAAGLAARQAGRGPEVPLRVRAHGTRPGAP